MKPTIASVWFADEKNLPRFLDLSAVWEFSAKKVLGDSVNIICERQPTPDYTAECPVFFRGKRKISPIKTISWMQKINSWLEIIRNTEGPILLCDIDIAFYRNPFPDVLEHDFDIGICGNNTGAVYFSGSKKSRKFMEQWHDATVKLYLDIDLYRKYDLKYKGLDQGSMGYLLETGNFDANVMQLPRRFHSTCQHYELPAYIMHYHSTMSHVIFDKYPMESLSPELHKYATEWKNMLRSAQNGQ